MIGIAGGMGPYAGLDFFKEILDNTAAESDQDFPDVLVLSAPGGIGDRTEYLTGKISINPGYAIAKVLLQLEKAGAASAGIPCNTAHAEKIFSVIKNELTKAGSKLTLFHLIEETVKHIAAKYPGVDKVGILSTTGSYNFNVYSAPLQKAGLIPVQPTREMQEALIHPAIYHPDYGIKTISDPVHPKARENLLTGIRYLKEQGAEVVILGCTEIPLAVTESEVLNLPIINPATVLARKLIAFEAPDKLKTL